MKIGWILALALFTVVPVDTQAAATLTADEECGVAFMLHMNTIMSGVSRDADEQMRRLAEEAADASDGFASSMESCKAAVQAMPSWPQERQDAVVEVAKCRYIDLLKAEYARDQVPMPDDVNSICVE
ncbi:hypothetical protein [Devosia riboflavina]